MTKVALFGGSFDPVHLGHLAVLHNALKSTNYSFFLIVPAKLSNFKQTNIPKASAEDRLQMLKLALEDYKELYPQDDAEKINISTIELDRGGVSYTYDTVMEVKKLYGITDRLGLIIGDDQIPQLTNWYRYEDLKKEVEFIICRRNPDGALWSLLPQDVCYTKIEPEQLAPQSSSEFRTSARDDYLSKRVRQYVKDNNLYNRNA
jgi:nicotinate-nucleotide adenylyltransferase